MKLRKKTLLKIFISAIIIPIIVVPTAITLSSCSDTFASIYNDILYTIEESDVVVDSVNKTISLKNDAKDRIQKKETLYDGTVNIVTKIKIDLSNLRVESSSESIEPNYQLKLPPYFSNENKITSIEVEGSQDCTVWISEASWANLLESKNLKNLEFSNLNFASNDSKSNVVKSIMNSNLNLLTTKTNLTSLTLSNIDNISCSIDKIFDMRNLTKLNLSGGNFENLLSNIDNLSNLNELHLSYDNLSTLPLEIGNLTKLKTLDLSGNKFESPPSIIGGFANLETLDLSDDGVKTLPKELKYLVKLTTLNLSNNEFYTAPSIIGKLTSLTALDLSYGRVRSLSPEMKNLKNLKTINLEWNDIRSFPDEILSLTNLENINMGDNLCIEIPNEISKLINLEQLDLSGSGFTSLPSEMGDLKNLTVLSMIGDYNLKSIPESFKKLPLISLDYDSGLFFDNDSKEPLPRGIQQARNIWENIETYGCWTAI